MMVGTLFTLFVVPTFYLLMNRQPADSSAQEKALGEEEPPQESTLEFQQS
jgi:hypothetical protein